NTLTEPRKKLFREATMWQNLRHPYILPFIGIDSETLHPHLCMVSPWMDGTVLDHLEKNGRDEVDSMLFKIAQGLEYLHLQGVVHGDLRGSNILVNRDWDPCLADFGLSRYSDASLPPSQRAGSTRWMAPELLDPERFGVEFIPTNASDVYAFGCVCLELYTLQHPFAEIARDVGVMWKIHEGMRPERPTEHPLMTDTLWHHVTSYLGEIAVTRPSAENVVRHMAQIAAESGEAEGKKGKEEDTDGPNMQASSSANSGGLLEGLSDQRRSPAAAPLQAPMLHYTTIPPTFTG
ncbi:kinase-like domain-containing protein, partial [Mycena maculata]